MREYPAPQHPRPTREQRDAAERAQAAAVAARLHERLERVRRDRPGQGTRAVLGVTVEELEAVLIDRLRLACEARRHLDARPGPEPLDVREAPEPSPRGSGYL